MRLIWQHLWTLLQIVQLIFWKMSIILSSSKHSVSKTGPVSIISSKWRKYSYSGGPVTELVITGFREQEWLLINGPHWTETFPPFVPHDDPTMEAVGSSKKWVHTYQITWHHIQLDSHQHTDWEHLAAVHCYLYMTAKEQKYIM